MAAVEAGERPNQKRRTRKDLLQAAERLMQQGRRPSLEEVAEEALVSRATAYRYFPSRSVLITAVVDTSLAPVRSWKSSKADGHARVKEMFTKTFPSFKEFEPQLRAAVQLSLEQWALERAGLLEEEPYRRGHRVSILSHAVQPFEGLLKPRALDRLKMALSVIYGIEPHMVLKDIWGANDREVEAIALWMADALVTAALNESGHAAGVPATGRVQDSSYGKTSSSGGRQPARRR